MHKRKSSQPNPLFIAKPQSNPTKHGFTIVELLVVIVVIGILATITVVTYTGVTQKATISTLISDLDGASSQLKLYQVEYGSFPMAMDGSNCPTAPTADSKYCLKSSTGNTLAYSQIDGKTFHLTNTNGNNSYSINDNTTPAIATTASGSAVGLACPSGYIPVPGSGTYRTNDFCVMRYEAKNDGSGNAVSTAAGAPWVSISRTSAVLTAYLACTDCHLIYESEWMTIAQNVLSVSSNWSSGSVGSGYIYSGHNDNVPANALAVTNTSDGYSDTGNVTPSNQRRTLTLTNGEVIWDLAGNIWEWTAGTTTGGQPGISGEVAFAWKQWTAANVTGTQAINPFPSGTGLSGSSTWNSTQGIGQLYSYVDDATARGFLRSGCWYNVGNAGVLSLYLYYPINSSYTNVGFRVAR